MSMAQSFQTDTLSNPADVANVRFFYEREKEFLLTNVCTKIIQKEPYIMVFPYGRFTGNRTVHVHFPVLTNILIRKRTCIVHSYVRT